MTKAAKTAALQIKAPSETPEMRFLVMIYWAGTNYCAMVPDLPGCVAVAKRLHTVKKLITSGIEMHLEGMQDQGEPIPVPRRSIEFTIDPEDQEAFCTWVEVKVPTVAASPR